MNLLFKYVDESTRKFINFAMPLNKAIDLF